MSQIVKVAVAGLGTVGGGVVKLITEKSDLMAQRSGRKLVISAVADPDESKKSSLPIGDAVFYTDGIKMAEEADADILVELIGGSDGVAKKVCETALNAGKPVVTANKALLAKHGNEMLKLAEEAGITLGFEAAVAGGIPVIKAIREGLTANSILSVYGILNGTCNYILTTMRETGRSFGDVLADAQKLGYAEADPTTDIEGGDTAHKLALLATLCFGTPVALDKVYVEGITAITADDIASAEELGYRIKLLGQARLTDAGLEQRVHPCLVPLSEPIAHVEDVFNAVVTEGDFVGRTVMEGRGAGERPTASAVVADIVDIATGKQMPALGMRTEQMLSVPYLSMDDVETSAFVRLTVYDRPGVVADVSAILKEEDVSMETLIQRKSDAKDNTVPVVMVLHKSKEAAIARSLEKIAALDVVLDKPQMIRIAEF